MQPQNMTDVVTVIQSSFIVTERHASVFFKCQCVWEIKVKSWWVYEKWSKYL